MGAGEEGPVRRRVEERGLHDLAPVEEDATFLPGAGEYLRSASTVLERASPRARHIPIPLEVAPGPRVFDAAWRRHRATVDPYTRPRWLSNKKV